MVEINNLIPLNYIQRDLHATLFDHLKEPEVTILYGARQVGKSSEIAVCIEKLMRQDDTKNIFYFNLDFPSPDFKDPEIFLNSVISQRNNAYDRIYVFIDEAQRLSNVGLFIKYIYDKHLNIKFVLTGSASLDIKERIKEPLTGRKLEFFLRPLSLGEVLNHRKIAAQNITGNFSLLQKILEDYLVYGGYPAVVATLDLGRKRQRLQEIADSYIQRDIGALFNLENSSNTKMVVSFLAESIGNLYSVENIAKLTQLSKTEVLKNIEALKKTFVISNIYPFHKNKAKELTHRPKIYFNDLGIRNAVLNKLSDSNLIFEKGVLFENAVAIQLFGLYGEQNVKYWRTINQTEVDFVIEKSSSRLCAYEVKYSWKLGKTAKNLDSFKREYSMMLDTVKIISKDNYWEILAH